MYEVIPAFPMHLMMMIFPNSKVTGPFLKNFKIDFHLLYFCLQQYFQSGSATPGATEKSYITLEWTNQHGCGGSEDTDPQKQNCHMVLQYMCQDDVSSPVGRLPWRF